MIQPGTVLNDIFAHEDMLPTLLAAAGDPDVKEKLLKGMKHAYPVCTQEHQIW